VLHFFSNWSIRTYAILQRESEEEDETESEYEQEPEESDFSEGAGSGSDFGSNPSDDEGSGSDFSGESEGMHDPPLLSFQSQAIFAGDDWDEL
jgi:hypothetical protein